jgi:hypothetical protein
VKRKGKGLKRRLKRRNDGSPNEEFGIAPARARSVIAAHYPVSAPLRHPSSSQVTVAQTVTIAAMAAPRAAKRGRWEK